MGTAEAFLYEGFKRLNNTVVICFATTNLVQRIFRLRRILGWRGKMIRHCQTAVTVSVRW